MTIQVAFQRIKLFILQTNCCITNPKKYESAFNITTTPEIICDVFSFLDKNQIERIQVVNQFWNNVIIHHKNILPLRQFVLAHFISNQIDLITTNPDTSLGSYIINFDGTNLRLISKIKQIRHKSRKPRYSHLTVDEVLKNLNDVIFSSIDIRNYDSEDRPDDLLNMMKFVTTKTGGRFRGISGHYFAGRFDSKLAEIFDNYVIVDKLNLGFERLDTYIREVCANPEVVQLPSTPKEIRLACLKFNENEKVLNFTCNGKLNGANRLTIVFYTFPTNYGNFIRQWFDLYRTHQNPVSLVGKFELKNYGIKDRVLDAIKTFINNTQLRVKYSLETKEFHSSFYVNQYVKRSCVLIETDSYALVIEMDYFGVTNMSSINASDLDQPLCDQMKAISFCVKSL